MKKQAQRYKTDDDGDEEEAQYVYTIQQKHVHDSILYTVLQQTFFLFFFILEYKQPATNRPTNNNKNNNKIMYGRLAGSTRQKYFF